MNYSQTQYGFGTQLMTQDGTVNGAGVSYINHVSTSDWFTVILDTNSSSNI
jgi:hypothetical protein